MPQANNKCSLCQECQADKTNSHIIPSFFLAMVSSVDGSYRRDKEVLYTIGDSSTKTYLGRSVLENEWVDSFDSMTDERIANYSKNSGAKDYIFCTHCEKRLGDYLESPWHDHMFKGRKTTAASAYFFWASILWRISFFEGINIKLPHHLEESLRKRLWKYLQSKDNNSFPDSLMVKLPFQYKVIYCKDYCRSKAGFVYYEYDKKSNCATLLLGDVAACFAFAPKYSFKNLLFHGLEKAFQKAPINDGSQQEQFIPIEPSELENASTHIIHELQTMRLESDRKHIMAMWRALREKHLSRLPERPSQRFVQFVVMQLYDENVKNGERITPEYFAKCFRKGLETIYNIPFIKR